MSTIAKSTSITFRYAQIGDQELLTPYFQYAPHDGGCEYTFANSFLWAKHYQSEFAIVEDRLVIRSNNDGQYSFSFPIGPGNLQDCMETLFAYCEAEQMSFTMNAVTNEAKLALEALYPNAFVFTLDRDSSDYVYLSDKLIHLTGKKFHSKRNHINRFKQEHPDWSYEPVTSDNMEECLELALAWCQENGCDDRGHLAEICVIKNSFRYFDQLGLSGGALRTEGKLVAFTLGEPLHDDTFVVHIEKAYSDVQGAYPMINREFVEHVASEYQYINREEDLGLEGLRKAKLSYRPELILEKYQVTVAE